VSNEDQPVFFSKPIKSWDDFTEALDHGNQWIYRGQTADWALQTSLERNLKSWDIDLARAASVELRFIRDFRRKYRGEGQAQANDDLLSCLSLMQHHGAPTRLLDFSYSPYVAARFAIGQGSKEGTVWCVNCDWCNNVVKTVVGDSLVRQRNTDKTRNDKSFKPMYMSPRRRFVSPETPFHLNERLTVQQGVFLCPGDTSVPFEENLTALEGFNLPQNVMKLCFDLDKSSLRALANRLLRMNIDSAALFPGADGFSRSLAERAFHYE
jgi:hypothetical protein